MRAAVALSLLSALAGTFAFGRSACSKLGSGSSDSAVGPAQSPVSSVTTPAAAKSVASAPAASAPVVVASASASTPPAPEPPPMRKEDWEDALGTWSFENGELVCEGKATSSVIFYKGFRAKDFELKVQFLFESVESSAGVLFRYQGRDFYANATFYQFEWYTRGSHHDRRLSLMRKTYLGNEGPYWIQIVEPKYPDAPMNVWKTYRVRAEGDHMQTWIDDELVFDKHDATFVRDGRVGLHTFMPRKMRYRRFEVSSLDAK
jgi:hypothetical protein